MRLCPEKSTKARRIEVVLSLGTLEGSKVGQETKTTGKDSVRRSEIPTMGNQCKDEACLGYIICPPSFIF